MEEYEKQASLIKSIQQVVLHMWGDILDHAPPWGVRLFVTERTKGLRAPRASDKLPKRLTPSKGGRILGCPAQQKQVI